MLSRLQNAHSFVHLIKFYNRKVISQRTIKFVFQYFVIIFINPEVVEALSSCQ